MRRKLLKLLLAASVLLTNCITDVPVSYSAAVPGDISLYKPQRQKYAIAPAALYSNADFYNSYVKTSEYWAFNSIYYFTDGQLNYDSCKSDYNATFSKPLKAFDASTVSFDPVLNHLREKGQLYVNFRVNLANAKSSSVGSIIAIQSAEVKYYRDFWGSQDSESFYTYGDMDYFQCKGTPITISFAKVGTRYHTQMKNPSLVFADLVSPKINSIYATATSDINGRHVSVFNSGTVYINIKFDEYIRFADNRASHNDVYLKLKVANMTGTQITGADEKAMLYSLQDDTLTFKYDIPASIVSEATNHYIYGFYGIFDGNNRNVLNAGENAYPLRVLTYTGELYGHYTSSGLYTYTSKSLITDLAGNSSASISVPDTNAIYIDTLPAAAKKVSFAAVGSKSQYIGIGGSITPTVEISDALHAKLPGTSIFQPYTVPGVIYARLNVLDKFGNNCFLQAKKFVGENTDKLLFNTLTVSEGMKLEEGSDRIIIKELFYASSDSNYLAYDKCGNPLELNSVSIPESQLLIDTEKPSVTTEMPLYDAMKYLPLIYDSNGGTDYDSFYFSFDISDRVSGLLPKGEDTLNGSFKWSLNDPSVDTSKFTFQYAVSNGTEKPAKYNSGAFDTIYAFPQNAARLYLHFKIADLEGIALNNSRLSITANDLVGNTATEVYNLYGNILTDILDKTPPEITVNRLFTFQDTDGKWKFASDFTLHDKGYINTGKVYYQWTAKGSAPSRLEWLNCSVLGENAETIRASVYKELIDNQLNEYDLYIKAADSSKNENISQVGPFSFTKNLAAPIFTSEAVGEFTEKAALKLSMPRQSTVETVEGAPLEVPAKALIMLEEAEGYSVKTVTADTDISIENVFSDMDGWAAGGSLLNRLIDGTYYGESNVRIVAGYGISYSGGKVQNPYSSGLSEQSYVLYTAPEQPKIHNIEMTSSVADTSAWKDPDDGPKYFTDLTGISFNIYISNSLVNDWGSKDIDFSNSYFALYKDGDPLPIYKSQLSMTTLVSIPSGLNTDNGTYYAQAVVTAKTSGKTDTAVTGDIIVDTSKPEDFGLSKVETNLIFSEPALNGFDLINHKSVYYGYDAVDNPMPDVSDKSYGSAPYLLLGSATDAVTESISHELYFTTLSANNELFIKLWNASEGVNAADSKAAARWIPITDSSSQAFKVITVDDAASVISSYSKNVIPLINNTENALYYQVSHANGEVSAERLLLINISDEKPVIEVELNPENTPSAKVTAIVTRAESASSPDIDAVYWTGNSADIPVLVEKEVDLTQSGGNWFYTQNIFGNYAFVNKTANHLDIESPVINISPTLKQSSEGDGYVINVAIKDKNTFTVKLRFDDVYTLRLGVSPDLTGGYFNINIPEEENGVWLAEDVCTNGIYKVERRPGGEEGINLAIYGVYLFDDTAPTFVDLGYAVYARDLVGNEAQSSYTITVKNVQPHFTLTAETIKENIKQVYTYSDGSTNESQIEVNLHSVTADFNLPVNNITPFQHHNAETGFSLKKSFLNIFKDGTYKITFRDIFGKYYSVEEEVTGISLGEYGDPVKSGMNITLTGVNPDTGKYSISVLPVANEGLGSYPLFNDGVRFTLFADHYASSLFNSPNTRLLTAVRANNIEFDQDEDIILMMMRRFDNAFWIDTSNPVIIIDGNTRQAPAVKVNWYYHEFASDTIPDGVYSTDDKVDVWITADRPISGINGKLTSHTFTFGGDTGYAFEYEDSDGIVGKTQITLPIQIVEKKTDPNNLDNYDHDEEGTSIPPDFLIQRDTTSPDFYMSIYYKFGSISQYLDVWRDTSGIELSDLTNIDRWTNGFILKFDITDQSKTRMILLNGENAAHEGITLSNAVSDTVSGVELNGNSVAVNKAAAFTVLIIDEADNKTAVAFSEAVWNKLDSEPPEIEKVEYEKVGFYSVNALFTLKDDKSESNEITLVSPSGLVKDISGRYVLRFDENKSLEIAMRDIAGNIGTAAITVNSIDDTPPAASVAWWSQCLISNGVRDITKPTAEKTNNTMTVKVVFDKNIQYAYANVYHNTVLPVPKADDAEMDAHLVEYREWNDYVTWSADADSVIVNFLQNATAELWFVGLNGVSDRIFLTIEDIIDKNAPEVTVEISDLPTDIAGKVVFKNFSEPVRIYGPGENGTLCQPGDVLEKTFNERGKYSFSFTDDAGNITRKDIEIKNIDLFAPGILLSDLPGEGEYRNTSLTFKATMSEEGTLTYQGISTHVEAPTDNNLNGVIEDDECNWVSFTAVNNGSYLITAEDIAGRKTNSYINLNCFDYLAPTISFNPAMINVLDSTDPIAFETMLREGVILRDDLTPADNISLSVDTSNVRLTVPGLYMVIYSAEDQVGNIREAIRYVRVFSARELKISVNGVQTEAKGVTIVSGKTVVLNVENLPLGPGEPYKVYLRRGIWTAGEMKHIYPLSGSASFTLPDTGCYYTLYLVTQNRGTYLTYLYAE